MAIVTTLDQQAFVNMFADYNRSDNFTTEAREALFDYYEEMSESSGTPFEMDVIAICCDWSELTLQDALNDYSYLLDTDQLAECEDDDDKLYYVENILQEETFVIRLENTLLVQCF